MIRFSINSDIVTLMSTVCPDESTRTDLISGQDPTPEAFHRARTDHK